MSRAAAPATRLLAAARSCNLHRPHSHRLCRIGSQVWPCPLIAASAAMPRVLDGGHGPHQAAARCVGTSRTDLGIAIVLVCSALRAGWSAGTATMWLNALSYTPFAPQEPGAVHRPRGQIWPAGRLSGLYGIAWPCGRSVRRSCSASARAWGLSRHALRVGAGAAALGQPPGRKVRAGACAGASRVPSGGGQEMPRGERAQAQPQVRPGRRLGA